MKKISKSKGNKVALRIVQKTGHPEVTKVIDAKKHIEIIVTPMDNRTSTVKDHGECAMAVACKRQQNADAVIISMKSAYVIKGNVAYRYQVPTSTSREVVSFDRSGGFAPGKYQLRAPSLTNRLGTYWLAKNPKKRPPIRPRVRHVTQNVRTSLLAK